MRLCLIEFCTSQDVFLAWPLIRSSFKELRMQFTLMLIWGFFLCNEFQLWGEYQHVNLYISTLLFVQGDIHDILNLRKSLLRAVLGHTNWKVCLLYILMDMTYSLEFSICSHLLFIVSNLLKHRCQCWCWNLLYYLWMWS